MWQLLSYGALCAAPAVTFLVGARVVDWYCRHEPAVGRLGRRRSQPAGRSLEQLVASLQRLEAQYAAVERSREPMRAHRLRALGLAYDDTLRECCLALGIQPPDHSPLSPLERVHTQTELALRGLTW